MTMKTEYRACVSIGALIAASLVLSGCLGPTYGTDKSATEQLVDDLGNIASIGSTRKGQDIEYKPRAAIVKPPENAGLPAPQQNIAENNPAWVESPEETRKRLIAEADAGGGSANTFRSPLAKQETASADSSRSIGGRAADGPPTPQQTLTQDRKQREAYKQARTIQQGAYSDRRRFLSDPPLAYRQPSETAPIGELGEPEKVKERRRIAEAKKAGTGKRTWWPW